MLLCDLIIYYISLYLAFESRLSIGNKFKNILPEFNNDFDDVIKIVWIPFTLLLFLFYERLYSEKFPYQEELRRTLKAVVFSFITVFFIVGVAKLQHEISRLLVFFTFSYLFILLPMARLLFKLLLHKLGIGIKTLLLIGFQERYREDIEKLLKDVYLGYRLIGIVAEQKGNLVLNDTKYKVRTYDIIRKLNLLKRIHTVAIFSEGISNEKLSSLVIQCQKVAKEVIIIPSIRTYNVLNLEIIPMYFPQFLFLKFKDNLKSGVNIALKTLIDYILTIIMLPIALIIGIFISIGIRLDSSGPIIISQNRIGKDGRVIKVYKFRTMYKNAEKILKDILATNEDLRSEWEEKRKMTNDPRVTRFGKFLRKTSLDELPQLINVLKGEMSLVGPRPVTEDELEKYYKEFSNLYLQVKPGITGYWQVSGRSKVDYETRVAMDVFYILNWSLWLDFFIIIKTVWAVIRGEGAY
jgi:undecaprenyl-phosphate galactose phosphotransferase